MEKLNDDVLEHIFRLLDFRALTQCELTCVKWQRVIADRRIYWQLCKRLVARPIDFPGLGDGRKRKKAPAHGHGMATKRRPRGEGIGKTTES